MSSTAPRDGNAATVIPLGRIDAQMLDLVGGKALGLARMMAAGERVPPGFCVTTRAPRTGGVPREEVLAAYRELGEGPVAVRSSATAEDLPEASFAGLQDTFLDVEGEEALLEAIERCWASLHSDRATAYRDDLEWEGEAQMAVVVQRMIAPRAAGVMFTANPITGTRGEFVIDATSGLGDGIVDGSVEGDHYVLTDAEPPNAQGVLTVQDLTALRAAGRRLEAGAGTPQDVEFALDEEGLWLLQSRSITTLFPLPPHEGEDLRAYMEVGHMQGFLAPFTPLGMSALLDVAGWWGRRRGMKPYMDSMTPIGGRLFMDLTAVLRHPRLRERTAAAMDIYGADIRRDVEKLLENPAFAPREEKLVDAGALVRELGPLLPGLVLDAVTAVLAPTRTTRRAFEVLQSMYDRPPLPESLPAAERIPAIRTLLGPGIGRAMMPLIIPLILGLSARGIAERLLGDTATTEEIDAIGRSMPHNITTIMDLELWDITLRAREHGDLFRDTPPDRLAGQYLDGALPEIGLGEFLSRFGYRSAQEIDLGRPRWSEDPAPVFAALAGYLRLSEPQAAPDARFAHGREEAERTLDRVVGRAARTRPLRALAAGLTLRRWRSLAGLREMPKFLWVIPLLDCRRQLLRLGEQLQEEGSLEDAADIVFVTLEEAQEAAETGLDLRDRARERRAEHRRESRRTQVPALLLSDGTIPADTPDPHATPLEEDAHQLVGKPAASGRATGPVRVVTDPRTAAIEPGEILVAATTDPGWTPLFLTAAGLVTSTGTPVAHGPTVAREYGIPAVICLRGATERLRTGQIVTIDGSTGTVELEEG
ncbi:PEP/pyruvate-binding domain-containing protein [Brachybacterium fresconis]|uniref:Pyruvate,water dikinase n=1 Tax=Brachybacterium fresconis TaxID=173363 RepID=A0ABS4YJP1_9MICO|nr:pyruvate,water dikinase [Brachybacterium fresconis]